MLLQLILEMMRILLLQMLLGMLLVVMLLLLMEILGLRKPVQLVQIMLFPVLPLPASNDEAGNIVPSTVSAWAGTFYLGTVGRNAVSNYTPSTAADRPALGTEEAGNLATATGSTGYAYGGDAFVPGNNDLL